MTQEYLTFTFFFSSVWYDAGMWVYMLFFRRRLQMFFVDLGGIVCNFVSLHVFGLFDGDVCCCWRPFWMNNQPAGRSGNAQWLEIRKRDCWSLWESELTTTAFYIPNCFPRIRLQLFVIKPNVSLWHTMDTIFRYHHAQMFCSFTFWLIQFFRAQGILLRSVI